MVTWDEYHYKDREPWPYGALATLAVPVHPWKDARITISHGMESGREGITRAH